MAHRVLMMALALSLSMVAAGFCADDKDKKTEPVSYHKQIRPLFQAHCHGCHQPAKNNGQYVMTTFAQLVRGGESESAAITPGKPDESYLLDLISPVDGKAEMPQGKPPLKDSEIELVRRWIAEGARDDTPKSAIVVYDQDHPPVYSRPPVIGSIDFSPDGKLLAIAGFHEVLLFDGDGKQRLGRLVGLSERIESIRFSPDGKYLAVAGGLPRRMGEIQIWNVEKKSLKLSVPVTSDTVYGLSWSPDGKLVAFGCADNSVRAILAANGDQVLYQGSHTDWVLASVFSVDGKHLISAGRDRTAKLIEVATQRFIDNVTSITPGALKGGIASLARHPTRDEIVIGGADGIPKVYRIFRLTGRVIGDDSNIIRELPPLSGRIYSVAVSKDGKRIAAGSSLDGRGQIGVYSYEFSTDLPDKIKGIMGKVADSRSPDERKALEDYTKEGVKLIARSEVPQSAVYAVTFSPDGKRIAAAGSDGTIRFFEPESGKEISSFAPAEVQPALAKADAVRPLLFRPEEILESEPPVPEGAKIEALLCEPPAVRLVNRFDYVQLVVTARTTSGEILDVTRLVEMTLAAPLARVTRSGLVTPTADGTTTIKLAFKDKSLDVPVEVSGATAAARVDFVRDVAPVLSKAGCNAGTCHGSAQGKNGFKFSLRGYDPIFDVRALTDDLASRRVNLASPDDSLMLLKATGSVPHVGAQLTKVGEPYYEIIRSWIAAGASLNLDSPRVRSIEIFPKNPVILRIGSKQQVRVVATYADGNTRDVTQEAFLESGNTEVAKANRTGLMTAVRRGEAAVLARFEGAYAATTLMVMGDRTGFAWVDPPAWGKIDELVAEKWKRMKILPSELCSDDEFLRRVYLDLTGLPPSSEEVRKFLADNRETRVKRDQVIDRLVGSDAYVEYWTNKWADLLQVNGKFLGGPGAAGFRNWIRNEIAANTPYDEFARKILTAQGSNRENPAASYFKILRDPATTMENTTHLFLGVRFNCNKCHDHPFERWTQDQYYETAAYFARLSLQRDPIPENPQIGGTAVEGAKPMWEVVGEAPSGEVTHGRTGAVAQPEFPYPAEFKTADNATRRQQLASWISSPSNQYFAKSYVNRMWGYLFGIGIIEPIDDIRASNPATNHALLEYLTREFIDHKFDVRHLVKLICKSRTYQLSIATNKWNEDDGVNYSHAVARRLPAEVLYDSIYQVLGAERKIPGVAPGTRAAALPDSGIELPSGFLATFGRPPRESACECERTNDMQMGPVMALISGPTVAEAIDDPNNVLAKLVATERDDEKVFDEIFHRVLNRPARKEEINAAVLNLKRIEKDHEELVRKLASREAEYAPIRDRLEKARLAAIEKARSELTQYQKEIAPRIAEAEKKRTELIALREAELKAHEAAQPKAIEEWARKQDRSIEWVRLNPRSLEAENGVRLVKQEDLSILAVGAEANGAYKIVAQTHLKGITGLRLEALADDRLPSKGPGRAGNGNFVVNKLTVSAASLADPKKVKKVALANPQTDFSQQGFDLKDAFDQRAEPVKGWAVYPRGGVTHWATIEFAEPVGSEWEGGTVLTVTIVHRFPDQKHTLGRFRLSVTASPKPFKLGLPDDLETILAAKPEDRSDKQKEQLLAYYRTVDEEYQKRSAALAEARKPLPKDPKLAALESALAEVEKPVPPDGLIEQLKADIAQSEKQKANIRLTAAQDLAWALINSPAFLFNR